MSFFKAIVVWFALFAAPVQGFAAATMICCEPAQPFRMMQEPDRANHADHRQAMKDTGHDCCSPSGFDDGPVGQCAACAACTMGATILPVAQMLPVLDLPGTQIPFTPSSFHSHIPVIPEPPPQASPV